MMKKIISILLALCLSGCTVLDFIDANNEYQTNDTYNNEHNYNYKYKEINTTEENQNQTKNGFTVKNSNESKNKNETDNNQTKNGFQLAEKGNKQLKSLYLFYYDQLSSTQKAVYEDLYAFLQKPTSMYYLKKPAKTEVNITLANSQWNFNQSSILHHLNTQNSTVKFEPTSEYKTLTIKGDLTGSATFDLNTNIAENKADKIIVKGKAEGDHHLNVTDHGAHVANGKVTLVETNTGNAKFHLANANGYVALGAYKYFLTTEGKNWVLAHSQSAVTPQPQPQPQPQPSITPSLPATAQLLESANAQVSLRQAELLMVENELNGIHQRLGEIRTGEKGNIWVKNVNSHQKFTALSTGESQTSGFKQNVHSLQIGADVAATDKVRLGGFVGHSQANIDFNNHYGNGKVKGQAIGVYGTYMADNGVYLDNIAQYSRLTANSNHTEKHRYNAYTLSSEIGKQFQLAGTWTVTPQAQLAWTHINGKEKEDSLSAISSRIGLRLAKTFELSQGWKLQPYAEANAITTRHHHSDINYRGTQLNVESYRGRFTSAVGFNAGFGNHRMGLEVNSADGKHIKQPFGVQAVYRFQW